MINIYRHPIWKKVNPLKKPFHLGRLLVAKHYSKTIPPEKMIAVVGSVGKTTTTIACKEVLSEKLNIVSTTDTSKTTTNLDPIFNIPMTILRARGNTGRVLLELGIEYQGEMEYFLTLVNPQTVVVSRLSYEHSEFLGDIDNVISETSKVVQNLGSKGRLILNYDDPNCRKLAEKANCEIVYYGMDAKNCHVWASNVRLEGTRVVFELNYGVERVEVRTNFLGFHQVYPLLAAACLGLLEDISMSKIKKALERVQAPIHRMQVFDGYNNSTIIDDTYNSSPVAVEEALDTLNRLPARRRIAVLGEMLELGPFSEKLHRQIAQKIYKDKVDLVLLGRGDARFIADELLKLGFIAERLEQDLQNPQIVSKLLKILGKGDVVLIKGSRGVRLDEVVQKIIKTKK